MGYGTAEPLPWFNHLLATVDARALRLCGLKGAGVTIFAFHRERELVTVLPGITRHAVHDAKLVAGPTRN